MPECEKCGILCKTAKILANHQLKSQSCKKYKNITFVCNLCDFTASGIKNIDAHIEHNCSTTSSSTQKGEKYSILLSKNKKLEEDVKKRDILILNLQLQLKSELLKNKIYTDIISKTDINLENVIKETQDKLVIHNYKNGNIPLTVFNSMSDFTEMERYTINPPKPARKKKKPKIVKTHKDSDLILEDNDEKDEKDEKEHTFKTYKDIVQLSEKELEAKLQKDTIKVSTELNKIVYDNFDISHKEITESIESYFNQIETTSKYTVNLMSIKNTRKRLLGKISLNDYIELLNSHNQRLFDIFKSRNYNTRKIKKNIGISLTPLDMRFIFFEDYANTTLEIDEIERFGLALRVLLQNKKSFVPYDNKKFINDIMNYGLALFELRDCIKRCLVNEYGFHNIIYINLKKSTIKDPYSFYSLLSFSGQKRNWKMESRMEDITNDFIDSTLNYCIDLFRKLYYTVFNDNVFRNDYMTKSQVTEFDCEQLLQTIILLAQPMKVAEIFKEILIENCSFTPTELDSFNLRADDKMQQKRLAKTKDSDEDIIKVIKRLFDEIQNDDALSLIETRK